MTNISVCAIQSDLIWESAQENRTLFDVRLQAIEQDVDLVLLPEMFSTGFSIHSAFLAESMNGPSHEWMKKWSSHLNAVVCGSLIIQEGESYINRMIWQRPDGTFDYYDKRHLFRMAGEDAHFSAGDKRCIVELKGMRFCLQICYDLRFPVWSRNTYG